MIPDHFVRDHYDAIARDYSTREARLYWLENHSQTAREHLRSNPVEVVIDIGCGSGAVIRKLADEFPTVRFVGVDFSREMLKIARASSPANRIEWIEADLARSVEQIMEIARAHRHVLLLAMGPMEYYQRQDLFSMELARLFKEVRQGAFIGTFLNRDLLGRPFFNKERQGKRYWKWEEAVDFFGKENSSPRLRFTACIVWDVLNFLTFLDPLSLALNRILQKLPASIAKRIAVTFEIEIVRTSSLAGR
jgi:SAM-dependent methyltransferase